MTSVADELADAAAAAGLARVGNRPPLREYFAEAWRRLPFATTLAWYRVQADAEENRLGMLWIVIRPLLTATVYGVVFYFVLNSAARPANFVPFLLVGVFVMEFFSNSLSRGSKAITGNSKLVQSLGFPRVLLPIATILEQTIKMVPIVIVLVILLFVFGERPAWSWFLVVPILLLMAVFNFGVALIVARLSVHLRDLQQVIPFVTRFLFYTSGVFFSFDLILADQPTLLTIVRLIPTYDFISLARGVLMDGHPIPPLVWIAAPVWAVVTVVFGFIFFWRAEVRYGLDD
jgi:teichoic acid transport system permease protein